MTELEQIFNIKVSEKRWVQKIKSDENLSKWVIDNSVIISSQFSAHLYNVISGESNICKCGKPKSFLDMTKGFQKYCGKSDKCDFLKEEMLRGKHPAISKSIDNLTQNERFKRYHLHEGRNTLPRDVYTKLTDETWLYTRLYIENKRYEEIARELGITGSTVREHARRLNIAIK